MTKKVSHRIPVSKVISIGNVSLGGALPPVLQSMTNANSNDVSATVKQSKSILEAGGEMVRMTTQGLKEVNSGKKIIEELRQQGIETPLIADVHFNARVAEAAAAVFEKIRINPGNFTERSSGKTTFSEDEYSAGDTENRDAFISLLKICKNHGTALRIGVNHGSLSKRIMSKYGDTPEGMVESAMEFLRICGEYHFENVVVSLKSSNTRVMVQAVRLLVHRMIRESLYYPVHLGVTEAGDGPDGRIRSVVGMAPLLLEGIGDTIRVSLTEPPEDEIPVAKQIRELFIKPETLPYDRFSGFPWDPFHYEKLPTRRISGMGGSGAPLVWGKMDEAGEKIKPDVVVEQQPAGDYILYNGKREKIHRVDRPEQLKEIDTGVIFVNTAFDASILNQTNKQLVIIVDADNIPIVELKQWLSVYYRKKAVCPIIIHKNYSEQNPDRFALLVGGEMGFLLIDGLIDGIWIENPHFQQASLSEVAFSLLQASRARITTTEFIACPSCGRTLFDIRTVLGEVKKATIHLTGLKIAVMGCIVNGPGEMADADYGYVGAGIGKVSLYKGSKVAMKNIPAGSAVEQLVNLIKENGDWKDA